MAAPEPPGDHTCPICYTHPPPLDTVLVPSCTHAFCAPCILNWSSLKRACPLCKADFSSLLVRRSIDGAPLPTPTPHLPHTHARPGWSEEPVSLLLRAPWVSVTPMTSPADDARAEAAELTAAAFLSPSSTARFGRQGARSEAYEDELEASCFADVEEEEDGLAADRRTVYRHLGNRRYGENGYVNCGPMVARVPAQPSSLPKSKKKKRRKRGAQGAQGASSSAPPSL